MAAYAIPGGEGLVLNKKNLDSKLNFWGGGLFCVVVYNKDKLPYQTYCEGRSAFETLVRYANTLLTSEGLSSSNALSLSMSSACVCLVFLWILSMVSWSLPIAFASASVRSVNVWICTVGAKVD